MSVNLKDVQLKLYEQLKPSGWGDKLKMFILSDDFYKILHVLMQDSLAGKKFTPTIKHLFKAFEECPYDQLKVVIVGQDPFPKEGLADGIAFSCSKTHHPSEVHANLKSIYKALDAEGVEHNHTYDLKDWANQGILMLNSALTTTVGISGTHIELWKPFMTYLLDILETRETGIVYILMGKTAQEWRSYLNEDNNFIFTCSHPASAAYSVDKEWYSNGVFKRTTETIKSNYNYDIKW